MTLLISKGNAMAAVGQQWRYVRDRARELGVPILRDGNNAYVEAAAFLAALKAKNVSAQPEDPEQAMRRRVFGARGRRP